MNSNSQATNLNNEKNLELQINEELVCDDDHDDF